MKTRTLLVVLSVICLLPGHAPADRPVQDPTIGKMNLTTDETDWITLTDSGDGENNLNFTYQDTDPVASSGVLYGLQWFTTMGGCSGRCMTTTYWFTGFFAGDQATFQSVLSSNQAPLVTSSHTNQDGTVDNGGGTPVSAMAANAQGWVIGAYALNASTSCEETTCYGAVTFQAGTMGALVNDCDNSSFDGAVTAVTPPLSDGTFYVGMYDGKVLSCDGLDTGCDCNPYYSAPAGSAIGPVTGMELDPVDDVLWVGDADGNLWSCPLSTSGSGQTCSQYNTFEAGGEAVGIVSLAWRPNTPLVVVSTLDGNLWQCTGEWSGGWSGGCWNVSGGTLFPPQSNGDPTAGYMQLVATESDVFALYDVLWQFVDPPTSQGTSWPLPPVTLVGSNVRAGPALFAGVAERGLSTDGTNVYALGDDGTSIYQCSPGAGSPDLSCTQWSIQFSGDITGEGVNLTALGSDYDYVVTPPPPPPPMIVSPTVYHWEQIGGVCCFPFTVSNAFGPLQFTDASNIGDYNISNNTCTGPFPMSSCGFQLNMGVNPVGVDGSLDVGDGASSPTNLILQCGY